MPPFFAGEGYRLASRIFALGPTFLRITSKDNF
jgi:hypothetical protein